MTSDKVLLSTTYFGPVQWYQKLHRAEHVIIEQWESFQKQTYRNRCLIALQSAYGESPFFEYYQDDIRPFFEERWTYLLDFNEAIRQKMCELIDIQPEVTYSTGYVADSGSMGIDDFRSAINPKHPIHDNDFETKTYYQVYQMKHGFLSNLMRHF